MYHRQDLRASSVIKNRTGATSRVKEVSSRFEQLAQNPPQQNCRVNRAQGFSTRPYLNDNFRANPAPRIDCKKSPTSRHNPCWKRSRDTGRWSQITHPVTAPCSAPSNRGIKPRVLPLELSQPASHPTFHPRSLTLSFPPISRYGDARR